MQSKNKLFYNNKKLKYFYLFFFSILDNNFAEEKDFFQEREEDFIENNNLNNIEEEESFSIKLEKWNTKKWGSLYLLFPYLSFWNFYEKFGTFEYIKNFSPSFIGNTNRTSLKILNFLLSGIIEYKWIFHKNCGFNFRLNLNNIEAYYSFSQDIDIVSFFSIDVSIEWVYKRKNRKIWSGSFSPIGFAFLQKTDLSEVENRWRNMFTCSFIFLKYEYMGIFYFNFFKIKGSYFAFYNLYQIFNFFNNKIKEMKNYISEKLGNDYFGKLKQCDFGGAMLMNGFSLEFGLNIIGLCNQLKKNK